MIYTANVYRDLQGLCGEIGVRGFQIYGDCMYTRNPCNIEISTILFPCKNCKDFDFTGIIKGIQGQSVFFNWALTERNVRVRLYFKVVLNS